MTGTLICCWRASTWTKSIAWVHIENVESLQAWQLFGIIELIVIVITTLMLLSNVKRCSGYGTVLSRAGIILASQGFCIWVRNTRFLRAWIIFTLISTTLGFLLTLAKWIFFSSSAFVPELVFLVFLLILGAMGIYIVQTHKHDLQDEC
ncbi:unnamed protein product [Allacma fusca]|uniref:Uncharacterized protein n=1 Tax=Allacma fusca TaxID=39272 RepID=A0A8J2LKF9_9HEXA|nr:unnamed protein product [Allacma fusca]